MWLILKEIDQYEFDIAVIETSSVNKNGVFVVNHSDSISQDKVDMLEMALNKYDEAFEKIKSSCYFYFIYTLQWT